MNLDEYITTTEAAAVAGKCELTVRRWIEAGRLNPIRRFGRVLVRRVDLDRLLAQQKSSCRIAASAR